MVILNDSKKRDLAITTCRVSTKKQSVIVDEPTRFMRSIDEAFYFEVIFKQIGVTVYYACDEMLNGDDPQAKLMRFMGYFKGETSNDDRERIAFDGAAKAVRDGRLPGSTRLGYKKTKISGIHRPVPIVSDLLKSLLVRVSIGSITPSQSLVEFNNSDYIKSGQHSEYRMDKWRKILTDPFYAGIISITTIRDGHLLNENGKHKPLISRQQHEMIKAVVYSKPKMRTVPRKGGNPKYRLNTFTYCRKCYRKEEQDGKDLRHNLGKFVGYDNRNGKTDKVYERYGCRKCHRSLVRDDVHAAVKSCFSSIDFSDDGRKRYVKALKEAWKNEEQTTNSEIARITGELPHLRAGKSNLINALGRTTSQDVAEEIEKGIQGKVEQIRRMEAHIDDLRENKSSHYSDFLNFALKYTDKLAADFFNLPLDDVKVCKELVFPGGFVIDEKQRVYTPKISPIYRLRTQKQPLKTTAYTQLVGEKGKTLHNNYHVCQSHITKPTHTECSTDSTKIIGVNELKEINAEIDRWYGFLGVKYMASKQRVYNY